MADYHDCEGTARRVAKEEIRLFRNAIITSFDDEIKDFKNGGAAVAIPAIVALLGFILVVVFATSNNKFLKGGSIILGILICIHIFHLGITAICVCMCTDNVTRYLLFRYIYKKEKWAKIDLVEY